MVRRLEKQHNALLFVTDIHGREEDVEHIISHVQKQPVDAIILGGDIPGNTKKSFHAILRPLTKLDVPVIVLPGSHENERVYKVVEKYDVWDCTKKRNCLVRYGEQELIFIPGSDVLTEGSGKFEGGNYQLVCREITQAQKGQRTKLLKELQITKQVHYTQTPQLRAYVEQYSNVPGTQKLVFAHVPLQQKTKKGIDYAQFFVPKKDFDLDGSPVRVGQTILTLDEGMSLDKSFVQKKAKNVGNPGLNRFLRSLRCSKFFCGHIHEAGRRAVDKNEKKIRPGKETKELYVNSGEGVLTRIEFPSRNTVSYRFY